MKNISPSFGLIARRAAAAAAAAMSVLCFGVHAQPGNTLEVLCPGASDQLADALDRVAREHREEAEVYVSFSLSKERAAGISVRGADTIYERAVRRAVRSLRCPGAGRADVEARFVLQFAPLSAATPAAGPAASAGSVIAQRPLSQAEAARSR